MLEVYTLGQIRLRRDGYALTDFISQKAEVLFVYLAAYPRVYQREVIASLFWSDTSAEQSMKNLRTALSSLQKQLADELLVDRQTIGINPETNLWLDIRAFEDQLAEHGSADDLRYKPPRSILRKLIQTIDLYGGDFLPGFHADNAPDLDDWVNLERERLRQKAMNAMSLLIDYLIDWGDYQTGITYAYRLLKLDPLSEIGIRQLIRLLAYTGDRNLAIRQFNQFKQNLYEKLEVDPEPETLALVEQAKSGRLRPMPKLTSIYQIPDPGGVFIERPQEIAKIAQQLDSSKARLITLCGVGGVGKTRLALHTALTRRDEYQHGAYYVPLATVQSADLVAPRILSVLPVSQMRGNATDQLVEYLRDKHMLLLLDNFEHVLDAASLVSTLLQSAPNVKILATSREPLQLHSEYVIRLDGLSLPPLANDASFSTKESQTSDAVRLFTQVARRVQPGFEIGTQLDTVVRICYLVDGLPLGIEIAAAHASVIPLDQIEANLDTLQNMHRDAPERHSGIRHLLADIWTALNTDEQQVLQAFAVFPGDFDLTAALAVGTTTLPIITRLVNKSLLQWRGERYDLHQIVWRYLVERLEAGGQSERAYAAHIAYYRQWLEKLEARHLRAHEYFNEIDVEYHNLWSALQIATRADQLYFAVALSEYWTTRGFDLQPGIDLLQGLTVIPDIPHHLYVRGLQCLGILLFNQTRYQEARTVLQQCLDAGVDQYLHLQVLTLTTLTQICMRAGDEEQGYEYAELIMQAYEAAPDKGQPEMRATELLARSALGYVNVEMGNSAIARPHLQIAVELAQELGELRDLASILNNLGITCLREEELEQAYEYFSRALDAAREIDHQVFIATFTNNLASVTAGLNKFHESFLLNLEAAALARQINFNMLEINILSNFVTIHKGMGQAKCAAVLQGATDRLRESLGIPVSIRNRDKHTKRLQEIIEQIGDAEFKAACATGQTLTVAQAIDFARQCYFQG